VFEDPETGVLGMIKDAPSAPVLRDISTVVIRKLFAREKDAPEIERFISELFSLIPDDAPPVYIPVVADAIIATLRGIKDLRKQKAQEYEEEQAAKAAAAALAPAIAPKAVERRKQTVDPRASFKAMLERKRKQRRNMGIAFSVLGLIATIGLYFWMSRVPPLPNDAARILTQQIKAAATGIAPPVHIYGGRLTVRRDVGEIVVTADGVPARACIGAASGLIAQGKLSIDKIELLAPGAAKELCERSGNLVRLTWVSG
jgi:hypothetical protein